MKHPEILTVSNIGVAPEQQHRHAAQVWHSDGAYTTCPPTGSLLHCHIIPSVGGSTEFTNMYLAYDALSEGMKKLIAPLRVINDTALNQRSEIYSAEAIAERIRDNPPVVHDMVKVHPETGKKALYLSRLKTREIEGMRPEESRPLLDYLMNQCERPENIFRHSWKVHDLILWDNRCTMHRAVPDFTPGEDRVLYRTTLIGEPSGQVYREAA
jgi:taurine dioxygenase